MRTLVLLVALVLSSTVSAQQASYTYIDQPPQYQVPGAPLLEALNTPKIGTTFQIQVTSTGGYYPVPCFGFPGGYAITFHYTYLLLGASNPAVEIPFFVLGGSGWFWGGFLFSSGEIVLPTPYGPPVVPMSIPIPNDLSLIGIPFFQQVVQDSQSESCFIRGSRRTISLSRGGHGVIGL